MPAPTIEEIVAQIRRALYGRDVRENIALGIEKCYSDVTSGVTTAETSASAADEATADAIAATTAATEATADTIAATSAANTATSNANTATSAANTATSNANAAAAKINNMSVTTTTLLPGELATVSVSETGQDNHKEIAFGIPRGITGAVPNISIGTVTTIAPDQSATVTRRSGSPDTDPIFDFSIPKGETGTIENAYASTLRYSESDERSTKAVVDNKINKVSSPTAGNLPKLDSNGHLVDSGIAANDVPAKANKPSSSVNGHLAGLDSNGNLLDSGLDYVTQVENRIIKCNTAITIPASSSTVTVYLEGLTSNHEIIKWNFSNSMENDPPVDLQLETYNGYFVLSTILGSTDETIRPVFVLPKSIEESII